MVYDYKHLYDSSQAHVAELLRKEERLNVKIRELEEEIKKLKKNISSRDNEIRDINNRLYAYRSGGVEDEW